MEEILRLAGVRDARVHDGRHTAATMLLLQGVDDATVMAVMDGADRRMLRRLYGPEPKKVKKKNRRRSIKRNAVTRKDCRVSM
jgi:integrase